MLCGRLCDAVGKTIAEWAVVDAYICILEMVQNNATSLAIVCAAIRWSRSRYLQLSHRASLVLPAAQQVAYFHERNL